jgi:adenylate kinase family enzyme
MKTKLILVEGLPGSGKSTTAQLVYDILKNKGIDTVRYQEGYYNHPADFDGVAYFNSEEFTVLEQIHYKRKDELDKIKVKYHKGYLIPYKKAIEEHQMSFHEELFEDITNKDIYELPIELHMELILSRWSEFASNHIIEDTVIIFECCFIQNPVTVSIIRNNSPKEVTLKYIKNLEEITQPLKPILIYVEQENVDKSFRKAVSERTEEWFNGFIDYYMNQGFGMHNKLKGLEGTIEVLKERSSLERDIFDVLKLDKYKIDNSRFDLSSLKKKINNIIESINY